MRPEIAIYIPWIVWYGSWMIAARWANATVKYLAAWRQIVFYFLEFGGFIILLFIAGGPAIPGTDPRLWASLWTLSDQAKWAMVGLATIGFLFCWWARIHLGRLWSGFITRKEGHRVVDTGPYRIVRHPIYTGVLTAALATMLLRGTGIAIVGFAVLLIGYIVKSKFEEGFLRRELGAAPYDAYAAKTAMLVPFLL